MTVLNILLPLIVLVALGVGLRKIGFASEAFFRQCNALVFWVALPALLLVKTATGTSDLGSALEVFKLLLIATVATMVLGIAVAAALRCPLSTAGVFVQGSFRGNLAYVGLAVIMFSFDAAGFDSDKALSLAALSMAPLIPLYNLASVVALQIGRKQKGVSTAALVGKLTIRILTNPLLIACVGGLALAFYNIKLPSGIVRSLQAIGQISLPLALMSIGASLSMEAIRGDWFRAIFASAIKLVVSPVLGIYIGRKMGLADDQLYVAAILLACPTAVASYVMADQMGSNSRLAGSIVLISTLLSAATLAALLAYMF